MKLLKFIGGATVSTLLITSSSVAFAADMDLETPAQSSASWTGFYVGAYVGAGGIVSNIEIPGLGAGNFNGIGGEGAMIGGMVGYNYQATPEIVLGVQADLGLTNLKTELNIPTLVNAEAKPKYTASISARIGWLPTPDTMLYAIGGFSRMEYEASVSVPVSLSVSQKYNGYHVGAGIETRLSSRLSARAEYRYTGYRAEDWGTGGLLEIEPSSHTATFGLAWKLSDPDPDNAIAPMDYAADSSDGDWTGFFAGAYVGAGAMVHNFELPGLGAGNFNGLGGEGFAGGVMVGYDYQASPEFVIGVQADLGLANFKTELNIPGLVTASAKPKYTASLSARAGWLASADTMLYVIGGFSRMNYDVSVSAPTVPFTFDANEDFTGFHVGAGVETKLASNFTGRIEYRYTDYGSQDWSTGGLLKHEPSSHAVMFGLVWRH